MKELTRVYKNDASEKASSKANKSPLVKMSLVIVLLSLVMTLSITSNYIFFRELFTSSCIILLVAAINFFNLKSA